MAAGASCTISVTFSPISAGSRSGTMTLTDNASNSPQTVALSGTGMDFTLSSTTTSQTVSAGQSANYSLTLAPQEWVQPDGKPDVYRRPLGIHLHTHAQHRDAERHGIGDGGGGGFDHGAIARAAAGEIPAARA